MPDQVDPELIKGYEKFRADFKSDQEFFERVANEDQRPKLMWIGCSDSRVLPEQITNAAPGDLFIVRNIANVVPRSGDGATSVGAAIEFAVKALQVEGIVVCGHTGCGGVQACSDGANLETDQFPHLFEWITRMKPARDFVDAANTPDEQRLDALVRANILLQIDNLLSYDCVMERRATGGFRLYAWLYDMTNGKIEAYDTSDGEWHPLGDFA